MKIFIGGSVVLLASLLVQCASKPQPNDLVIAFGSCGDQQYPQPVLERVVEKKPNLFLYLGDNIYSDTYSMDTLRMNYAVLGNKPEYKQLKATTKILATWDDHDYGWNDSGRHYPFKEESKEIFLNFFGDQEDSTIRQHPGIYHTYYTQCDQKRVQIVFLDMRTFRDKLLPYNDFRKGDARFNYEMDYEPYATPDSTLLGEAQWAWLEKQLREPADIRLIASSTQFGITHNGYEAWANFPHERRRFLDLIKTTHAEGVVFLSGDVHYAELSKLSEPGLYPLYDLTASGITSKWGFATPNDNRLGDAVMENHFGLVRIGTGDNPEISLQIHDVDGVERIHHTIRLSELKFK